MTFEEARKFSHARGYKSVYMTEREQQIDYMAFVFGWRNFEEKLLKDFSDEQIDHMLLEHGNRDPDVFPFKKQGALLMLQKIQGRKL